MSLISILDISAQGMNVQKQRLDVASQNLANINSTQTPEGGPYKKKNVVVSAVPVSFEKMMQKKQDPLYFPRVDRVVDGNDPLKKVYDPQHPDADQAGYVNMPNINATQEMVDVMTASKIYEANITVMNAAKSMALRTLEIGGL